MSSLSNEAESLSAQYAWQRMMMDVRHNALPVASSVSSRAIAEEIARCTAKPTPKPQRKPIPYRLQMEDASPINYRKLSEVERELSIDFLKNYRRSVEIMLNDVMQKYINNAIEKMVSQGLFKHNLKKCAKRIESVGEKIQTMSRSFDEAQIRYLCTALCPQAVDAYIECGGTITGRMQASFYRKLGKEIELIWFGTKNLSDKYNLAHTAIAADIQMIALIGSISSDLYTMSSYHIDQISGMKCESYTKNVYANELIQYSKQLLFLLHGNKSFDEDKEAERLREQTRKLAKSLADKPIQELREACMTSLLQEFIEFSIAFMRIRMNRPEGIGMDGLRSLFYRLGTKKNVKSFIGELEQIPYPSDKSDEDIFDYMETLPDTPSQGSAIGDYRRLCLKGSRIIPGSETEQEKAMRYLRQEVYRSEKEELSIRTLKALYARLKTKKAVADYIAGAGSTLNKTIRRIKRMKVAEFL